MYFYLYFKFYYCIFVIPNEFFDILNRSDRGGVPRGIPKKLQNETPSFSVLRLTACAEGLYGRKPPFYAHLVCLCVKTVRTARNKGHKPRASSSRPVEPLASTLIHKQIRNTSFDILWRVSNSHWRAFLLLVLLKNFRIFSIFAL